MPMKAKRKSISIQIEFVDWEDAEVVLSKIALALRGKNKRADRVCDGELQYQWEIEYLSTPEYREELINGKWCIVIPSKINKNDNKTT